MCELYGDKCSVVSDDSENGSTVVFFINESKTSTEVEERREQTTLFFLTWSKNVTKTKPLALPWNHKSENSNR